MRAPLKIFKKRAVDFYKPTEKNKTRGQEAFKPAAPTGFRNHSRRENDRNREE
jgi:hypothetical protein